MFNIIQNYFKLINAIKMWNQYCHIRSKQPSTPSSVKHCIESGVFAYHKIDLNKNCNMTGVEQEEAFLSLKLEHNSEQPA